MNYVVSRFEDAANSEPKITKRAEERHGNRVLKAF